MFRILIFFLSLGAPLAAQTLVLDQSNCTPSNATNCLRSALGDASVNRIVLADVGEPWVTDGLLITRDGVTLALENSNVILQAEPGALEEFESLVQVQAVTGVTIEGNGGTFLLDRTEYDTASQFRHGINAAGSIGLTIQDLLIQSAPGDGILVGAGFTADVNDADGDGDVTEIEPVLFTRDISITNVVCDDNNRQGISVTSVIGMTVEDCAFNNTAGTLPGSGVDFEPFRRYQPMQDIVMRRCTFAGNWGNGIQVAGVDMNAETPVIDILIEDALVTGNASGPFQRAAIDVNNTFDPFAGADVTNQESDRTSAPGTLILRRVKVEDESFSGLNVRQYASGIAVQLENVTFENVANTPLNANAGPVLIQPVRYGDAFSNDPCFGNVSFDNVTIIDDQTDRAQVTVSDLRSGPSGPADVTGAICVEFTGSATGEPINFIEDATGCQNFDLEVSDCATLPVSLTSFTVSPESGCRAAARWSVAQADGLVAFVLEKSTDRSNWETVTTQRMTDDRAVGQHAFDIGRSAPGTFYRLRSDFLDGARSYSTIVAAPECDERPLAVWPNPAGNTVNVRPEDRSRVFLITDLAGRELLRRSVAPGTGEFDVSGLNAGTYFVRELLGDGVQKLVVQR